MKKIFLCIAVLYTAVSCHYKVEINPTDAEQEIRLAEAEFNALVKQQGIAQGFYTFADDNATINTLKDSLIIGKDNIKNYYSQPKFAKAKVTWATDFVAVSKDGTLGYTYGKFKWTNIDSLGKTKILTGIFHTVWKKQSDGSWKYVWD